MSRVAFDVSANVMVLLFGVNRLKMFFQLRRLVTRKVTFGAFQRGFQRFAHVRTEMLLQVIEILRRVGTTPATIRMLFRRPGGRGGRRGGGRRGNGSGRGATAAAVVTAVGSGGRGGGVRRRRNPVAHRIGAGQEGKVKVRDGKSLFGASASQARVEDLLQFRGLGLIA